MQVQWCDHDTKSSNAIETWQGCCTLWNIPDGTHFDVAMATCSVPVSCLFKIKYLTICGSARQSTWSYLRRMPVPPSLGLLIGIFNCIFCTVQLQMVIFDFKEEVTRTEHLAIATSKCVPSGIFRRVQHPCQVSIDSLFADIFLVLCNTTTVLAETMTSSVTKFA